MAGEVRWRVVDSVTGEISEVVSITQPTLSPAGNPVDATQTTIMNAIRFFTAGGVEGFMTFDEAGVPRTLLMSADVQGNRTFTG